MDICDKFNYGTESPEGYWNVVKQCSSSIKLLNK